MERSKRYDPPGDWLILQAVPRKLEGNLVLTSDEDRYEPYCKVVAAGPGRVSEYTGQRVPMDIKVGDFVQLRGSAHPYYPIKGDAEHVATRETNVITRVHPEHKVEVSEMRRTSNLINVPTIKLA